MSGPHSCGEGVMVQQGGDCAVMMVVANHYRKALAEEVARIEGQDEEEVHEAARKAGAPGVQWVAPGVLAGQVEEAAPSGPSWELP